MYCPVFKLQGRVPLRSQVSNGGVLAGMVVPMYHVACRRESRGWLLEAIKLCDQLCGLLLHRIKLSHTQTLTPRISNLPSKVLYPTEKTLIKDGMAAVRQKRQQVRRAVGGDDSESDDDGTEPAGFSASLELKAFILRAMVSKSGGGPPGHRAYLARSVRPANRIQQRDCSVLRPSFICRRSTHPEALNSIQRFASRYPVWLEVRRHHRHTNLLYNTHGEQHLSAT